MNVHDFVSRTKEQIEQFHELWLLKHAENPEQYPLDIPDDNCGVWQEMFTIFQESGKL